MHLGLTLHIGSLLDRPGCWVQPLGRSYRLGRLVAVDDVVFNPGIGLEGRDYLPFFRHLVDRSHAIA